MLTTLFALVACRPVSEPSANETTPRTTTSETNTDGATALAPRELERHNNGPAAAPPLALPSFAEVADRLDADVVVMGAVARNRWKRLFIGATAERTLEHLPCDLLIVKPDWFQTPVEMEANPAS